MNLQKTVIIAYTDIGAAGSRAVFGLDKDGIESKSFTIDTLGDIKSASCPNSSFPGIDTASFQPFEVFNCPSKKVSCIVINAVIPGLKSHLVADYVLDLCAKSAVEQLVILSVLHLDESYYRPSTTYENCLFGNKLTGFDSLPNTVPIRDPFLSILIQMMKVERIPTSLLTIPGYRTREGSTNDTTLESIVQFHRILENIYGLKFDVNISKNMVYKGRNDVDEDMAYMIYL